MKFAIGIALTAFALSACAGPHGNPNGSPYADEPGGTMAVKPQTVGTETYDPTKPAPPFRDMRPLPPPAAPATPVR